jgi:hypothetical protein
MASRGAGSYKKGADYERKIAKYLQGVFNIPVKRTPAQESAKVHGGDVNAPKYLNSILSDFFWELKRRESWDLIGWHKKACDDAGNSNQIPIVVTTKNREEDYVFLRFNDFVRILNELEGFRKEEV